MEEDRRAHDRERNACEIAGVLGELVLAERALLDGTTFCGVMPRGVLLVENAGPFLDLPVPDGWLVAHVPGWNTRIARLLLDPLAGTPWVHFGDLDPNGVRIFRQLRQARVDLRWFVPEFWGEYVDSHGLRRKWPEGLVGEGDPPLVRMLAERGLWMEQEVLVLDARVMGALAAENPSDLTSCPYRMRGRVG